MSKDRTRVRRGNGLTIMAQANLRALLRQLYREHGSWHCVAKQIHARRTTIEGFYHDDKPGSIALARRIAQGTGLSLDNAIDGQFVITERGVKPSRGAQ